MLTAHIQNFPNLLVKDITFKSNSNGESFAKIEVALEPNRAFLLLQLPANTSVQIWNTTERVWIGSISQIQLQDAITIITAIGSVAALNDIYYFNTWTTTTGKLVTVRSGVYSRSPEKYNIRLQDNMITFNLKKNQTYINGSSLGTAAVRIPIYNKNMKGVSFDVNTNLPANWVVNVTPLKFTVDNQYEWHSVSGGSFPLAAGIGNYAGLYTFTTIQSENEIWFDIYNNTGVNYTHLGEDDQYFCHIFNVRIVTDTTNMVNTTSTSAHVAGNIIVTPVSMANIYVGQRLIISSGAADSESVIVQAVTATTFTVTFTKAHAINFTIQSFVVYPHQIIKDITTTTAALRPDLSPSLGKITDLKIDVPNATFEGKTAKQVIDELLPVASSVSTQFIWYTRDKEVVYEPLATIRKTYSTILSKLALTKLFQSLVNSVWVNYKNESWSSIFTNIKNTLSIEANGIERQKILQLPVSATNILQDVANTYLTAYGNTSLRLATSIPITNIYWQGIRVPLTTLQVYDTVNIINLPLSVPNLFQLNSFYILELEVDTKRGSLEVTPMIPLQAIDFMLST